MRYLVLVTFVWLLLVPALSQPLHFADYVQIQRSSAEVGVADIDGDGINDILISGAKQHWYKGPEFTQFYEIGDSDGGPYAARVADMNNDGFPDFVTSDGGRQGGPSFRRQCFRPGLHRQCPQRRRMFENGRNFFHHVFFRLLSPFFAPASAPKYHATAT